MRQLLLAALLISSVASAQTLDPVPIFESLINEAARVTNSTTPTYLNSTRQLWAKRRYKITDVKYDVRKTDSLLTPVVGLAAFTLELNQTALVGTREEAEALSVFIVDKALKYKIALTYSFKESRWQFKDGEFQGTYPGAGKYPITQEEFLNEPNALFTALLGWVK